MKDVAKMTIYHKYNRFRFVAALHRPGKNPWRVKTLKWEGKKALHGGKPR